MNGSVGEAGSVSVSGLRVYVLSSSLRNSCLVSPVCCIMARSVPFLRVWCLGTVTLCVPSVRKMWLPFWWTILNPALFKTLRAFRHDRLGSFSDSYFHQLFLSLKLVEFFWEGFEVAFYGFADVVEGLFSGFALADCSGKLQTLCGVSAFRFFAEDDGEFEAFDFDHKPNQG